MPLARGIGTSTPQPSPGPSCWTALQCRCKYST